MAAQPSIRPHSAPPGDPADLIWEQEAPSASQSIRIQDVQAGRAARELPSWLPRQLGLAQGADLARLLLEDVIHDFGTLGQGRPDLVPVDALGDGRPAVPDQAGDVF